MNQVLQYLTCLFKQDLSYSTINTARSSISALLDCNNNTSVGSHPLIIRFMKGVYQLRPPKPRYKETWNISPVLGYLRSLYPTSELSLKQLTLKLVMLVALITAQRLQTLQALDLRNMFVTGSKISFVLPTLLKQTRPRNKQPQIDIPAYKHDIKLDVHHLLINYIKVTEQLRGDITQLFITYSKPHRPTSRDTLGRWLREVMQTAGIDIKKYTAHSTRSAAVSAAQNKNLPVEVILQTAGWTSENTFAQFYNKPVENPPSFAETILSE